MPFVDCKKCGNKFYTKPNWLKRGYGKYCSVSCKRLSQKTGAIKKCATCSIEVYKSLKDIKKSKSGKLFCSKKCSIKWLASKQFGENHGNWKHGEFAYKSILKRNNISQKCVLCGKDDRRILVAHHIDKNRKNNVLRNLSWLCLNCHFLVHHYSEVEQAFLKKIHAKGSL